MPLILLMILNPLNDVTTSFDNPPRFEYIAELEDNRGEDLSYDSSNVERQRKLHPEIVPLFLNSSANLTFNKIHEVAENMESWKLQKVDLQRFRIEGTATTKFIGFKDDFVIEVRPVGDTQSEIHMRSKSRLGKTDFGANAKRIGLFFQKLGSVL